MKNYKTLQKLWEEEQCPILDGIFFATGNIYELDIENDLVDGSIYPIKNRIKLIDFLTRNKEDLRSINKTGQFVINGSETIVSGEGSWGGDGFIASIQTATNKLNWIFASDKINPIVSLEIENEKILAENNCGNQFKLVIDSRKEIFQIGQTK